MIDANDASAALAAAPAGSPAPPAAELAPRERFRVRGTFRAAAQDPPRPSAILIQVLRGGIIHGSDFPPAFPEGAPAADGTVLHWFETELTAPQDPGKYSLELAPRGTDDGPGGAAAPGPLTLSVREPDPERL